MFTVAITGNAGSGKTTVCEMFQRLGVFIISTDEINRNLLKSSGFLVNQLEKSLDQSISENGIPDKGKIWEILISSPSKRYIIESILHPVIMANVGILTNLSASPYCIIEIPLLFESGFENCFNRNLLITAGRKTLENRLGRRNRPARGEITDILETQKPDRIKFALSDDILFNNGTLDTLEHQVSILHHRYINGKY